MAPTLRSSRAWRLPSHAEDCAVAVGALQDKAEWRVLQHTQRISIHSISKQRVASCGGELREGKPGRAGKTLRFCYDRLSSLLKTLEITDMDDFTPLHMASMLPAWCRLKP